MRYLSAVTNIYYSAVKDTWIVTRNFSFFQNQNNLQNLLKKKFLCFASLAIPSLTRSLLYTGLRPRGQATTCTLTDIATYRQRKTINIKIYIYNIWKLTRKLVGVLKHTCTTYNFHMTNINWFQEGQEAWWVRESLPMVGGEVLWGVRRGWVGVTLQLHCIALWGEDSYSPPSVCYQCRSPSILTALHCTLLTVLNCFILTLFHCFILVVLHCFILTILHWTILKVLHCSILTVMLRPTNSIVMLHTNSTELLYTECIELL